MKLIELCKFVHRKMKVQITIIYYIILDVAKRTRSANFASHKRTTNCCSDTRASSTTNDTSKYDINMSFISIKEQIKFLDIGSRDDKIFLIF